MDPRLYTDLTEMPDPLGAVQDYAQTILADLDDRPATPPSSPAASPRPA